ncbi:MAG: AtpZ/AtpI family protein [Gemmatimonadaceae bacterium]|nr:AtpZ/AtpI family protein [Gemmatimonadaceae bacterium]
MTPEPPAGPAPTSRERQSAQQDAEDEQRRLGTAAAGAGMQFVVSILVFVYAGQWLDRKFGTDPLWLLVGLFVGAGGSFISLYRRLMAAQSKPPSKPRPKP